ncbi:MAG: transposase, partial [Firmicutes bacterium]|nr:transposase [Bacillota bacterium]
MQIQTLIANCAANELAKDILTLVFNQIMEQQRTEYIKANDSERCDSRQSSRNGY